MIQHRLWSLAALLAGAASAAAFAQPQSPIRQIPTHGVELPYVEEGQGAPVIFIHGAVGDLRFWEPQRSDFAEQHRFVAYTLRYHGTAAWPDEGSLYSVETHAADLAALIEALNGGPAHLVGLSYGATVAALAALERPDLVRTLTLAEPTLFGVLAERPDGKQALEEWNRVVQPMAAAVESGDAAHATRLLAAFVTGTEFDSLPPPVRQLVLDNARTLPLLLASPPPDITCERLRSIEVPTLIIQGDRTRRTFASVADAVSECIPGSRRAKIANASHSSSVDNPSRFNRTVLDFLAETTESEQAGLLQ